MKICMDLGGDIKNEPLKKKILCPPCSIHNECSLRLFLKLLSIFNRAGLANCAGLAQLVERLTAEWEVVGLIPGVEPILRVLK